MCKFVAFKGITTMGSIAFRVCTFEGSFPSSVGNLREVAIGHIDRNTAICTDVHCVGWTKKKVD